MHSVNKANNRMPMCIGISLAIVLFLFSLSAGLAGKWFAAFTNPGNYLLFLSLYFAFMWLYLIIGSRRLLQITLSKQLVLGAIIGYFISVVALFITNYFAFPDGAERLSNSVENFGISALLITSFARAFILGGWVFGLISIPLLKVCVTYIQDRKSG